MSAAARNLRADFLASHPDLAPFYGWPTGPIPTDIAALRAVYAPVIEARQQHPVDRQLLVQALTRQQAALPHQPAVAANIETLALSNTWTVTTGQQPGLFGGPLYTLYKTLTVIRLAEALRAAFPDQHFVPVFWIASEDHDWAEVNHAFLGYDDRRTYAANVQGPVGRHHLTQDIQRITAGLPAVVAESYRPGHRFGDAFRVLWHTLFGAQGLVVLEPDDAALKQVLAPVIEQECRTKGAKPLVDAASTRLAALGYPTQIQARDINLFGLTDDSRPRLIPNGERVRIEGTEQTLTATEAAERAADISPGVVLRPVYQEVLLPNLAYIGGWAEVAYWAQLRDVFRLYDAFFPVLHGRMQARLIPADDWTRWTDTGLDWADLDRPLHSLREELVLRHWDPSPMLTHLATAEAALLAVQEQARNVDPGQSHNVGGQATRLRQFGERLRRRLLHAQARQNPEWVEALAVKQTWQPDGVVQERVLNWLAFAGYDDPTGFIRALQSQVNPLATGMQDLVVPSAVNHLQVSAHAMQPPPR